VHQQRRFFELAAVKLQGKHPGFGHALKHSLVVCDFAERLLEAPSVEEGASFFAQQLRPVASQEVVKHEKAIAVNLESTRSVRR
jgi:hypothetical protein